MKSEIKLNLGCGSRNFGEDWDHIDGEYYRHIKSKDIFNLPYEDESVSLIYSSHVIEYFDRDEIKTLLTEWKRVLKQGGHLRLAVPDFTNMCALYSNGNVELKDILGPLYGKMPMERKEKKLNMPTLQEINNLWSMQMVLYRRVWNWV